MGATGVAAWLAQHVEGLGGITAIAGYVATGAAALTSMIAPANKRVRAFLDSLTRAKQDYDVQLAATLEENPENAEIKKHRDQHDAAALKLQAAREHVAELELRRAKLDPFKQLSSFLNERVQADDYRRRQGIIALVRRDFERLSTLMKAWRTGEAERPQNVEPIDRIILYVDDLDRCTPQQVVQMLEATHLLLAMDLFVVVAAVDSRWLLRSLEVHYERLLDDSGREPTDDYRLSSPQNYLEKIFQIPFAVRAMEEDGFGEYAEHLLGTIHGPEKAAPTGPKPTDAQGEAVDTPTTDPEADPSDPTAPRPEEPLVPEAAVARPLTISDEELAFFKLLHPLVPTPRVAKRIANVFRLVKTWDAVNSGDAASDLDHEAVLLLLGVLYGRPGDADGLFRALLDHSKAKDTGETLALACKRLNLDKKAPTARWTELRELIEAIAPQLTVAQASAALQLHDLPRYSLVTGRSWHTWAKSQPAPTPARAAAPA